MSHELKRLVQEAMRSIGPDALATDRARSVALRAVRGRYGRARRLRFGLALAVLLLLASGLGFGLGQWLGPAKGSAAATPVSAVGFQPAKGWNVVQRGIGSRTAVASNVPLTAKTLPPHGIVITATLTPRRQRDRAPRTELPLSVVTAPMTSARERRMLASVGAYELEVRIRFGVDSPSQGLLAHAQRELERLVVGAEGVTMFVRFRVNPTTKRPEFTFSGSVASRAAGEDVAVVGRDCGVRGERLIAGTQTVAGGGWEVQTPTTNPWDGTPMSTTPIFSGATLRARWNDQYSEPFLFRQPIFVNAFRAPGARRAWVVIVNPTPVRIELTGKAVTLQRSSQDRWVPVRRAKLVKSRRFGGYEATFAVPTRGLTLRAVVPTSSVSACFLGSVTEPWRS